MEIQISVRNLVEFLMREGDIDNRRAAGGEDAMLEGGRIHRMIQKRMGPEYESEVMLQYCYESARYTIRIEGRADGVIRRDGQIIVDEIKATYRDLNHLHAPVPVHLAQAKLYACMLLLTDPSLESRPEEAKLCALQSIGVRMTYCNIDTEEIKYFHESYTQSELRDWFSMLMDEYRKWADFEVDWKEKRQESIHALSFPFAYREGQKELAGHVYQTICYKRKLFIQAPTGVGKTISTVFPAVKAVGEQKADKIFYLTAKTITRTVAEDTFALLRENGLACKSVTLTAKEKICPLEETKCNPEHCPYAKGHFSRINDAIYDLLTAKDCFDRETILAYAEKHSVCPFEMSLDMSLFSDAVICDYNYLFDPYARLKRFFAEGVRGPYLFLIDEAHNLVERGRDMYSADMIKEDFLELKKLVKPYHTGLDSYVERCNKELLRLKKLTGTQETASYGQFAALLSRLHGKLNTYLEEHEDSPIREQLLDFYFQAGRYLDVNERIDENYVTYTQLLEDGRFQIRQFCVNPSGQLAACMDCGVSSILFSATFLPIQYYKQLLGGTQDDFEVYAKTAFSKEQLKVLIGSDVTSRYTRRSETEYRNIAAYIHAVVSERAGNYMVFCPSHLFLEHVYDAYMEAYYEEETVECIIQEEYMNEQAREAFLARFSGCSLQEDWERRIHMPIEVESRSIVGFCVLGGIFSEGIDLKGESLIGAIIVGTGLPQVCLEREILREYFDKEGKNGFDYAYRYPGMNKVLQAAGRVIRTTEDRGVVTLLDDRFSQAAYQKMFPREWEHPKSVSYVQCQKEVGTFWRNNDISSL